MPRYFFHVDDGIPDRDQDGQELPDVRAARVEAIRACGEMLREAADRFSGREWRMEVTDESGAAVITLRFLLTEHLP